MAVLVITQRFAVTADYVVEELNRREVSVFRADLADFPQRLSIAAMLDGTWTGTLRSSAREVELREVTGVWYRRPTSPEFRVASGPGSSTPRPRSRRPSPTPLPKEHPVSDVRLRNDMVEILVKNGDLRSSRWRRAFERVPRHLFVPEVFVDRDNDGRYAALDGTREDQRAEWLRAVYADDTLTTQLDGDDHAWLRARHDGTVTGIPTSSSTQPELMALMLEVLDVRDDTRVLEIGTGTGYNAAVLCEGLGDHNVVSVDVDAGLVERARQALRLLGYRPGLATVDGAEGQAQGAPYDRIIATCSLPAVPSAWLTQVREGGLILVNLNRGLGGGALVRLTVTGAPTRPAGASRSSRATCRHARPRHARSWIW